MIDKLGLKIEVGTWVDVPEGKIDDPWTYGFTGQVVKIYEDGFISVKNSEFDCFDIKANRVILTD
jgi:hypothetical protein